MTEARFRKLLFILVTYLFTGCGENVKIYKSQYVTPEGIREIATTEPDTTGNSDQTLPTEAEVVDEKYKFCSPLSFEKVNWNASFSLFSRRSFAIALSITGNYEGHSGWTNITNNFDGQGMSAGLLNQTLGTGSLQPLLSQMQSKYTNEFASAFSASNYKSILGMLNAWRGTGAASLNAEIQPQDSQMETEFKSRTALPVEFSGIHEQSVATNASVKWAVSNLYQSNGNFKPDWKTQIQTILGSANYVSLQIGAAERIHLKALQYVKRIGFNDLRTYLLMFDIVTQNGSYSETRFKQWEAQIKTQNLIDRTKILKVLVDFLLLDVNPIYRNDVKSRKYTIIDGVGTVHGANLNLPKSFCYKSSDPIE